MSKQYLFELEASEHLKDFDIVIPPLPELRITYIDFNDRETDNGRDVKIMLDVNGHTVVLGNKMKRVDINGTSYEFQAISLEERGGRAYLRFNITKRVPKAPSPKPKRNEDTYALGEKFSLRLPVTPSSDFKWNLELSSGLILIDEQSEPDEDVFVIESTKKGRQFVVARYGPPGREKEYVPKITRYTIV